MEVKHRIISMISKANYLVLNIDENLSWNNQSENVNAEAKSGLSVPQKLKDIFPHSALAAVY